MEIQSPAYSPVPKSNSKHILGHAETMKAGPNESESEWCLEIDTNHGVEKYHNVFMDPETEQQKPNLPPNIMLLQRIPKLKNPAGNPASVEISVCSSKSETWSRKLIGKLKLADLKYVAIPNIVKTVGLQYDKTRDIDVKRTLESYIQLHHEPKNVIEYNHNFENLIHFEEVADYKSLRHFDLMNVTFEMICKKEQLFKVKSQRSLSNWTTAFHLKKIDALEIKPVRHSIEKVIAGKIQRTEHGTLIVKVHLGFSWLKSLLKVNPYDELDVSSNEINDSWDNRLFDIEFQTNRLPYLLQHNALEYLKTHELFEILIKNSKYEDKGINEQEAADDTQDTYENFAIYYIGCVHSTKIVHYIIFDIFRLNFQSPWLQNLNEEQKRAVKCIVQGENVVPFQLFGPPGRIKSNIYNLSL